MLTAESDGNRFHVMFATSPVVVYVNFSGVCPFTCKATDRCLKHFFNTRSIFFVVAGAKERKVHLEYLRPSRAPIA